MARHHTAAMTQARKTLVDPTHAATYHCVARCVRRTWLCGFDDYARKSFEHRKPWVERRILEMGEIFACGIYAYADGMDSSSHGRHRMCHAAIARRTCTTRCHDLPRSQSNPCRYGARVESLRTHHGPRGHRAVLKQPDSVKQHFMALVLRGSCARFDWPMIQTPSPRKRLRVLALI